jgi:uncharacterized delta-60 repeat protein
MSISKPFAYNVGGPISGTTQYGDLVVGNIETDYSLNYGGVKWWGGPDEELGYVVGNARPGGQPVPVGVTGPAYVGFWRSKFLTDNSFLSLANYIGAQNSQPPFTTTSAAVTWLNNNGYYTSYIVPLYYVGGNFTTFAGSSQNFLIGLNSDGSKNSMFNVVTGFTGQTVTISIQSDGKIIVGGGSYSGGPRQLVRLNSNGSKDETFNIGGGFSSNVISTSLQSDGKIIVGGNFGTFSGISQNRLVRLNSNGSKDDTFNIGSGFNGIVWSTFIQSDGKILVGGAFTTYTGSTNNYLIRLNSDGSKDTSFNIGSGFNDDVRSIQIQSDGKIIVGGLFTTFTGSSQNRAIRLNSNGSKDSTFNIGNGFNSAIETISIQSDGKIIVGGSFTTFTGSSQNGLIRLNSDGSKDTTFDIGSGFNSNVISTEIQSDGKILVGGDFTTFSGSSQNRLIRLNSDGSKDTSFNIGSGFNDFVITTAIQL